MVPTLIEKDSAAKKKNELFEKKPVASNSFTYSQIRTRKSKNQKDKGIALLIALQNCQKHSKLF